MISASLKRVADAHWFQNFIIGAIIVAAIVVGIETYPEITKQYSGILHVLENIILWVFAAEVVIKLGAQGRNWKDYFKDGWNIFDFLIVVICFVPIDAQFVAVLRLARLLRVLKLVTALPRLQLIVGALLKSIPSIGYVGLLLGLHFYIFAVLATTLFGTNDPFRFGTLQASLLTLFQIVTMENWAELMHTQMYGCDKFGYSEAIQHLCTTPQASPIAAPAYFIVFILLGTMIILNLFIGVIMKGMEEMQAEVNRQKADTEPPSIADLQGEMARLSNELRLLSEHLGRKSA